MRELGKDDICVYPDDTARTMLIKKTLETVRGFIMPSVRLFEDEEEDPKSDESKFI